jgi:hypothetical protein
MWDKPVRAFPALFSNKKTLVAFSPLKVLERYSTIKPRLIFLLSETPVKISNEVVKKLDRATSLFSLLLFSLVCEYKLLNHLMSIFPFSNNLDGV